MIDEPAPNPRSAGESPARPRSKLLAVSAGTSAEAFRATDWAMLLAVAVTWGASFLFIDIGLDAFSPTVIAFGRIGLGAAALAFVPSARGRIDRADWPRVVLLGVIWMAVPLTLFPIAEQWVSSALAGMLNGAMPIVVAVVATGLGLRRPGRIQIAGLVVGFVGVVMISAGSLADGGTEALGVALILVAVVCYSFSANLAVPLQQRYGGPALLLRVECVGAVLTAPGALWGATSSSFRWSSFLAVLVLGIAGTGFAFAVMAVVSGRVGATRGSVVTYLMPPISLLLGVTLRNDPIDGLAIAGMVVVLAGAVLVSRRDSEPASVTSGTVQR